ncbi:MAG: alkaline phosphatase family protein [Nanoarchaeota archaeon]
MSRVFVFGIDGMPPELVFSEYLDELPTIKKLMENGIYGKLRSTIPPSTILAWSAFASGYDPGQLGVYSYTYRVNSSLDEKKLVNSTCVKKDLIWDVLSKHGKKCIVLNVPLTYPAKKINGIMVTDFLTPDFESDCTYPKEFKQEIRDVLEEDYMFDVSGFVGYKAIPPKELLKLVYKMTDMQIKLALHLLKNEEWDFFMSVFIGSDRLHHMMWKYTDKSHPEYSEDPELRNSIKDYYKYLDSKLAEFLKFPGNDATIIVSSDHGMVKTKGRINLSDWLIKEGYLVLKEKFREELKNKISPLKLSEVDWSKTKAYSVGAYQGRIYINRKKRDPYGIVDDEEYEFLREELKEKILKIPDVNGKKIDNAVFKPEDIYDSFDSESPDLIVFFDGLAWGVNPDIGHDSIYSERTLAGADSAGHALYGSFIMSGNKVTNHGKIEEINILDVAPTMYEILGIENEDVKRKPIKYK